MSSTLIIIIRCCIHVSVTVRSYHKLLVNNVYVTESSVVIAITSRQQLGLLVTYE